MAQPPWFGFSLGPLTGILRCWHLGPSHHRPSTPSSGIVAPGSRPNQRPTLAAAAVSPCHRLEACSGTSLAIGFHLSLSQPEVSSEAWIAHTKPHSHMRGPLRLRPAPPSMISEPESLTQSHIFIWDAPCACGQRLRAWLQGLNRSHKPHSHMRGPMRLQRVPPSMISEPELLTQNYILIWEAPCACGQRLRACSAASNHIPLVVIWSPRPIP